jgi:hypothetical protein
MVEVLIWSYRGSNVAWGHAALRCGSTYISYWPGAGRTGSRLYPQIYAADPIRGRRFEEDLRDEGTPPDAVLRLDGLDEKAILGWWRRMVPPMGPPSVPWRTFTHNCSTVVAEALRAGGGNRFSSWWESWRTYWTPSDVLAYARSIREGLEAAQPRKAGARL